MTAHILLIANYHLVTNEFSQSLEIQLLWKEEMHEIKDNTMTDLLLH